MAPVKKVKKVKVDPLKEYAVAHGVSLGAACKKGKIQAVQKARREEYVKTYPNMSLKEAGAHAKADVPLKQKSDWNEAVAKASRKLNLPSDGTKATAQANFKRVLAEAQANYVPKPKKVSKKKL